MKYKYIMLSMLVAALCTLFCGCGPDADSHRLEVRTTPFTGASHHKVATDGANLDWVGGEELLVNSTVAAVTVEGGRAYIDDVPSAARYRALYPASLTKQASLTTTTDIVLPSEYHYAISAGRQQLETPMAANDATGPITLRHLTGALCITISNTSARTMTVDRVTVLSDHYRLSGDTLVNFDNLGSINPVTATSEADRTVALVMDRQRLDITSGSSATVTLPVPAVGADNHFTVTVSARERGARFTYSRTQSAGGALSAGVVGYLPVEITNAEGGDITKANLFEGTGKPADPYIIKTPQDFAIMADALINSGVINNVGIDGSTVYTSANYRLDADIDMEGLPIGVMTSFSGTLDGDGHTVSNISVSGTSPLGLYGQLTSGSSVSDITFNGLSLATTSTGSPNIGGLSATATGVTVANCHITGLEISAPSVRNIKVGGIVATLTGSADISNCSIEADLTLSSSEYGGYFGGIVGSAAGYSLAIANCTTAVDATLTGCVNVGGLVGNMNALSGTGTSEISSSQWSGTMTLAGISSQVVAGGLAGTSARPTAFTNCNAEGSITITTSHASNRAGALLGYASRPSQSDYSYTGSTSSVTLSAPGGTTGNPSTH
ncbi:MAG: hypothetical protein K5650_00905 [Bacteroidales bacterium]|nr:hypothetical protein [Bacteroidales bacterium]